MLKFSGFADLTSRVVGRINTLSRARFHVINWVSPSTWLDGWKIPPKKIYSKCQSGGRNNTYNWNNASKHIAKQNRHWNRQALEWTREHGKRSRIIGSRNYAIHRVYHTSLRPSSLFEPRHPSLTTPKVNSRIDAELATMASRGNRTLHRTWVRQHLRNDPFAGSPTKTLLRLFQLLKTN